jgi:Thioesterase-like superfamily
MRIARITLEIFGPIPKIDLTIETKVLRPGKRVKLVEATLLSGGKVILVANVWRFSELGDHALPPTTPRPPPPALPDASRRMEMWDTNNGYFRAFEWRAARGSSREMGPAAVWCRTDLALIEGEPNCPRDVLLSVADSANGISLELPLETWLSIPASVTVSLARDPVGEWASLDAATLIGPDGRGVTTGILGDLEGEVGNIVQALLVSPR